MKKIPTFAVGGLLLAAGLARAEAPSVSSGTASQEELEKRHRDLEADINRKLDEIDRQIADLRRKAEGSEVSVKQRVDQEVRALEQAKPMLARKLADLDVIWADLKTGLEQTAQELDKALGSLKEGTTPQRR